MRQAKKIFLLFTFLLLLLGGIGLHFYRLNWGSPFFFHPDERNIAGGISNLRWPRQWNPHFFAYGSFPLALIYSLIVVIKSLQHGYWFNIARFEEAILVGRFLSALLSVLISYRLAELVAREGALFSLPGKRRLFWVYFFLLLSLFLPGLIQFAHFATFEIYLTFFYLLLFERSLKLQRYSPIKDFFYLGLLLGLSVAIKITSLVFFFPLLVLLFYVAFFNPAPFSQRSEIKLIWPSPQFFLRLGFFFLGFIVGSLPFYFFLLPWTAGTQGIREEFWRSLNYEREVALGTLPVFYTASFLRTRPILYQLLQLWPYLLGPALWLVIILAVAFSPLFLWRERKEKNLWRGKGAFLIFLLGGWILPYFLSQAFLWVKWIRYQVPLLPFLLLLLAFLVFSFEEKQSRFQKKTTVLAGIVLFLTILSGLFLSRRYRSDTRLRAAAWAQKNLSPQALVLSEVWDLGIMPFNEIGPAQRITLFNFYQLDGSVFGNCGKFKQPRGLELVKLSRLLSQVDYIVLPSERIWSTRLRLPDCFPNGARFYGQLFQGSLGFVRVYQTPTETWREWPLFPPPEETFNVFDYPTVQIWAKVKDLSLQEYERILAGERK